jgi:hypothetical protein
MVPSHIPEAWLTLHYKWETELLGVECGSLNYFIEAIQSLHYKQHIQPCRPSLQQGPPCTLNDEKCEGETLDRMSTFVRRAFTPALGGCQPAQTPKVSGFVKTLTAMISNASQTVTEPPKPTFHAAILKARIISFLEQCSTLRLV